MRIEADSFGFGRRVTSRVAAAVLFVVLASSCTSAVAAETLVGSGFESGSAGAALSTPWVVSGAPQRAEFDQARAASGTLSGWLLGPTAATYAGFGETTSAGMTSNGAEQRFWVYCDSTNQFRVIDDWSATTADRAFSLQLASNGAISVYTNRSGVSGYAANAYTQVGTYSAGWTEFRIVYDFASQTYQLSTRTASTLPWTQLKSAGAFAYGIPFRGVNAISKSHGVLFRAYQNANLWVDDVRFSDTGIPWPAPTNLAVHNSISPVQVTLSWMPNGAAGYHVYRDGSRITSAPVSAAKHSFVDTTSASGLTYAYTVTSVDPNGRESASSTEVRAPAHGPAYFADGGFEYGVDGAAWSGFSYGFSGGPSGIEYDSARSVAGAYSMLVKSGSLKDGGGPVTPLTADGDEARFWLYFDSTDADRIVSSYATNSADAACYVHFNALGEINVRTEKPGNPLGYTTGAFSKVGEYSVGWTEFRVVFDFASQTYRLSMRRSSRDPWTELRAASAADGTIPFRAAAAVPSIPALKFTANTDVSMWVDEVRYSRGAPAASSGAPSSVTDLRASGNDSGGVVLQWTPAADTAGVVGYRLHRGIAPGSYTFTRTLPASGAYTDTEVASGARYYYAITAFDATGKESSVTAEAWGQVLNPSAPASPVGLSASVNQMSINLVWAANQESDIDGYNVYMNGIKVNAALVRGTSFTHVAATPVGPRLYSVSAVDTAGNESSPSAAITARPDLGPSTPVGIAAIDRPNDDGTCIMVSWAPGGDEPIHHYDLVRAVGTSSTFYAMEFVPMGPDAVAYDDTTCVPGVSYRYMVRAVDASGRSSAFSSVVSATAIDDYVTFADPALESAVRGALGITAPVRVMKTDMLRLTTLSTTGVTDLAGIEYASNLEYLWMPQNKVNDFSKLSGLTKLKVLNLSVTGISNLSPLASLTSLEELYLSANPVTDLSVVANFKALRRLSAMQAGFTNVAPLAGLTKLEYLNLGFNSVSDVSALSGLTALQSLDLNSNKIADVSALVANQGLGSGDTVRLEHNVLDVAPGSTDLADIETLRLRGATVTYDPQNDLAPRAPTGVTATGGAKQVTLGWSANTEPDLVGYNVYRGATLLNAVPLAATSLVDAGLSDATTYVYTVKAVDAAGNVSDASVAVSATTDSAAAPPVDTTLLGNGFESGTDGAALSSPWVLSGAPQRAEYDSARYKNGGLSGWVQGPAATTYAGVGETATAGMTSGGAEQRFWVYFDTNNQYRVIDDWSSLTADRAFTIQFDTAGSINAYTNRSGVTGYTSAAYTPVGSYSAGWTEFRIVYDFAAQTYQLSKRSNATDPWTQLKASGAPTYGIPFRGVNTVVQSHGLLMRAYNGANLWLDDVRFSDSGIVAVSTSDTTAPSTPGSLVAVDVAADQGGKITLSWADASDNVAVTGYKVYRGTAPGTYAAPTSVSPGTTYTDASAVAGTRYYYAVSAIDAAGNESAKSVEANAVALDNLAPAAPAGLVAVGGYQQIALTWSAGSESDLVGYNVYRAGVKVTSTPVVGTSYTDIGLSDATSYSYTVRAVDAAGNESAVSAAVTATTTASVLPATSALDAGFESGADGSALSSTWTLSGVPQRAEHDSAFAKVGSISGWIKGPATAAYAGAGEKSSSGMTSNGAEQRFWVYFDSANEFRVLDDWSATTADRAFSLQFDSAGSVNVFTNRSGVTGYGSGVYTSVGTYSAGWTEFRIVYDFGTQTYQLSKRSGATDAWTPMKSSSATGYAIPFRGGNTITSSHGLLFRAYQNADMWLDHLRFADAGVVG